MLMPMLISALMMMTMTRMIMMMMTIIHDHGEDDFSDEVCVTNWQWWDSPTNISHPLAHISMICNLHDNFDDYVDDHH